MFKKIPASKNSISNRKPIQGVGINDADYRTSYKENGARFVCQYYKVWGSMINRCYSSKMHKVRPAYKECSVCSDWLIFSNFKSWMINQDWQGKHLDKDILIQGNKIYSPNACVFVEAKINTLLNDHSKKRGKYPVGVYRLKETGRFKAQCSVYGSGQKHLGVFSTPEEAHNAYKEFKIGIIQEAAKGQTDSRIKEALLNYRIEGY